MNKKLSLIFIWALLICSSAVLAEETKKTEDSQAKTTLNNIGEELHKAARKTIKFACGEKGAACKDMKPESETKRSKPQE